jgi:predicted RNA-binding protein with PIN domain
MRWIVDGYNVIRRDPDLAGAEARSLGAGRAALQRAIAPVAQRIGDRFTIVFDGESRREAATIGGRIEAVFSRPPLKADDVIFSLAGEHRDAAIVVTSDRRVSDAAWRSGATAVPVERFVQALVARSTDDEDAEDEDDEALAPKRGNPARTSAKERAIRRALRRLASGPGV